MNRVEQGRAERDLSGARGGAPAALVGVLSRRVGSVAAWDFAADVAQGVVIRQSRGEVVVVADVIRRGIALYAERWGGAWRMSEADVDAVVAGGAQAWERAAREARAA